MTTAMSTAMTACAPGRPQTAAPAGPGARVRGFFAARPRLFRGLSLGAPAFLFFVAVLRCWLETAVLSGQYFFSYYTFWHHVLWYWSTFLAILLAAHLVLSIAVRNLLWLAYGTAVMGIPLLVSVATGQPLHLEYFQGPLRDILFNAATFCVFYEPARPVAPELFVIFAGMAALGTLATGRPLRGLVLAVCVHVLVCALATQWFGVPPNRVALFVVESRLTNHALQALVFLHVFTALCLVAALRAGAFSAVQKPALASFCAGVLAWGAFTAAVAGTGWFTHGFDVATSGCAVGTDVFVLGLAVSGAWRRMPRWSLSLAGFVLVVQALVWGPLFWKREFGLLPAVDRWFWMHG